MPGSKFTTRTAIAQTTVWRTWSSGSSRSPPESGRATITAQAAGARSSPVTGSLARPGSAEAGEVVERVLVAGDLGKLSPNERAMYYLAVCRSLGIEPLTRPFEYLEVNGRLTLYAR